MAADWERIRTARTDITDWVIHATRGRHVDGVYVSASESLRKIIQSGVLKPGFARRRTNNTVRGKYPAICLTEQPLSSFAKTVPMQSGRYSFFAVAFHKHPLYNYGARPVIYGDFETLRRLNSEDENLWVEYYPLLRSNGYPIDWTHEREWRVRSKPYHDLQLGMTPEAGMPLLLPHFDRGGKDFLQFPRLIVPDVRSGKDLRSWMKGLPNIEEGNLFLQKLRLRLLDTRIIPMDVVIQKIQAGDKRWERVETVPQDECTELLSDTA